MVAHFLNCMTFMSIKMKIILEISKGDESMFAIGEAKSKVTNSKVMMPSEYRLKSKTLYGVWVGDHLLYISDEKPPLKAKERERMIFEPYIDVNNRLSVPAKLENFDVQISGCISTIEICFQKSKNEE